MQTDRHILYSVHCSVYRQTVRYRQTYRHTDIQSFSDRQSLSDRLTDLDRQTSGSDRNLDTDIQSEIG